MSKAFLYLRKSYSLISRLSSLLPWIILRSSVMNALRYSSNSLKSSSSSSNGHRELSTGLFKSEQFNQEGLTPGSRAQRSIYCSPGRAIWRDHSERMDEAAVRLHQHFRRDHGVPGPKLIREIFEGIPHNLVIKTPKYAYQKEYRIIGSRPVECRLSPDKNHPGCKIEEYGHAELDLGSNLAGFSSKASVPNLEESQDGLMLKLTHRV